MRGKDGTHAKGQISMGLKVSLAVVGLKRLLFFFVFAPIFLLSRVFCVFCMVFYGRFGSEWEKFTPGLWLFLTASESPKEAKVYQVCTAL